MIKNMEQETKKDIVNLVETTGLSLRDIANKYGISHWWVKVIYERETGKKYKEIYRVRRMNKVIKKYEQTLERYNIDKSA